MRNLLIITLLALFASCRPTPTDVVQVDALPEIFPDYIDVTIPPVIAPMNFAVNDAEWLDVEVKGSVSGEMHIGGEFADFDIDQWHALTKANVGGELIFSVCAKIKGKWLKFSDFSMHVSAYELPDYGLTYRRIAPGYEVYSRMGLYERELGTFRERELLLNTRVPGMCINCHASNRGRTSQAIFHVRGDNSATIVKHGSQIDVLQARQDTLGGMMVYPSWHPSGRYCAFSTNQTRQGFHVAKDERIEVFDFSSDVLVYDVEERKMILDTIVGTKIFSENTPNFSADGTKIIFTSARQRSYPLEAREQRYNLLSIDFDAENGRFGTTIDTLFNAERTGKSVCWPRTSPDGRYLIFALTDYGYFSIWHAESDLWLMDLETKTMRSLSAVNSAAAESYPNWSSSARWFVFTSRRADGLYSQLFIASIDVDGHATKPFLLPQRDPVKHYKSTIYSFNTPDFVSAPTDYNARELSLEIESDRRLKVGVKTN